MPPDEPVFCECYANKAVASMALGNKERIRHRRYMGRDTIIKHFMSLARRPGSLDKYIAIIDKEYGGSVFIDKICERGDRINIDDNRIYMCRSTITGTEIILIIFDPNIEEAFLCRLDKRICNDPRYRERVKSEKGEKYVENLLRKNIETNEEIRNIIEKIKQYLEQND